MTSFKFCSKLYGKVMDATRTSDGRVVAMKLLPTDRKELSIWSYLSSTPLKDDPRNHSVPLLGVHPLPDTDDEVLAVMPLLVYFHRPPFETLGELLLCIHTYLEVCVVTSLNLILHHMSRALLSYTSIVSLICQYSLHLYPTRNYLSNTLATFVPQICFRTPERLYIHWVSTPLVRRTTLPTPNHPKLPSRLLTRVVRWPR